ncbi:MAG: hypothetical protein JOZ58_08230, partial [Acetobacteraceae bacterium]|nr:hypothetical protein [Acetobacteraceae bacterium]
YGSDAQKRLAAELVLAGGRPAICITEPGKGSAASEMTTRADRHGKAEKQDHNSRGFKNSQNVRQISS